MVMINKDYWNTSAFIMFLFGFTPSRVASSAFVVTNSRVRIANRAFGNHMFFRHAFQLKNKGCKHQNQEISDVILSHRYCFKRNSVGLFSTSVENNDNSVDQIEPMSNLYLEWTIEADKMLWENHRLKSTSELAAMLGRGLSGVEARLAKLKDVNSKAYERLFTNSENDDDVTSDFSDKKKEKLIPSSEILRRIQWDYTLPDEDFSVLYYDRVDDTILEARMDAPNNSIKGKETNFVHALPEHRIFAIKYKERIVWDRESRMDLFFGGSGSGVSIEQVMAGYDEWKQRRDAVEQWNRERQAVVSDRVRKILGETQFTQFKQMASDLQSTVEQDGPTGTKENESESFIASALEIFRHVRNDPSNSLEPSLIPTSDYLALDCISELVALLPEQELRGALLQVLSKRMNRIAGSDEQSSLSSSNDAKISQQNNNGALPELDEDELVESFVRGTGSGGQKINKTSNKVILVHQPTHVRVECQETRSLAQNRKIARKRLRLKLDEYFNGNQSRTSLKAKKAVNKKSKAKARSRARQRKKKEEKMRKQSSKSDTLDNNDDFY